MTTNSLPSHLQSFFADRLIVQKEASPHTVASYRDTFRLLLGYACEQIGRTPTDLLVTDIDAYLVARFLCFIEDSRQNSTRTRADRRSGDSSSSLLSANPPSCIIASRFSPFQRSATTNE